MGSYQGYASTRSTAAAADATLSAKMNTLPDDEKYEIIMDALQEYGDARGFNRTTSDATSKADPDDEQVGTVPRTKPPTAKRSAVEIDDDVIVAMAPTLYVIAQAPGVIVANAPVPIAPPVFVAQR